MASTSPDCTDCANEHCLIKRNCLAHSNGDFLKEKTSFVCKKGQQFIIEGAPVQGLFFLFKGKAKVAKTGINGREQIVRFCKDGEMIGHRGFAMGDQYHISAVAIEDTVLCNFSNKVMMDMVKQIPSLTYDLMLFYADELNKSENRVRKIAQMTVRERVVDTLLYLHRKYGAENDYLLVELTRKELADYSGTTDEQVIRIISALKKEGLLRTSGKKIRISDFEKLKKEISEHNFFISS